MHLFVGSFGGVSGAIGDMCDKYKNSTDAVFSVPVYISFCKYGQQRINSTFVSKRCLVGSSKCFLNVL